MIIYWSLAWSKPAYSSKRTVRFGCLLAVIKLGVPGKFIFSRSVWTFFSHPRPYKADLSCFVLNISWNEIIFIGQNIGESVSSCNTFWKSKYFQLSYLWHQEVDIVYLIDYSYVKIPRERNFINHYCTYVDIQKFNTNYLVMHKVQMHTGVISWLEYGSCVFIGDNPLADARALSSCTDAYTIF